MLVRAKWQIAYKNQLRNAGDIFELSESDFDSYKNDVIIYDPEKQDPVVKKVIEEVKVLKKERNKRLKKEKTK